MKKKNFLARFFQTIGRLFDGTMKLARKLAFIGIDVTNALKQYVDDGSLPIVIEVLAPQHAQHAEQLYDVLPQAIDQLNLAVKCTTHGTTRKEMLLCLIRQFRAMTSDERKQKYLLLAALITQLLGDLKFGVSVEATQSVYNEFYDKN